MSTVATRAIARAPAGCARVPARASGLAARRRVSSAAALRESATRHLGNTARAAVAPRAAGRADEAEPGWYDVPATSNFIDVRSEDELRDVMRAAYGNERASTLLVVEFYGKWCNSCRRLYPRLRRLAEQEQDVLFCKIDFDACKDLCRKLGVVKLPYFHVYNGSGSRLADFAASLDPAKFKRLTDAIQTHRAPRCVLKPNEMNSNSNGQNEGASLVKLHHVTVNWYGGGEDVQIAGDVAGGWTHTLAARATNEHSPKDDAKSDEKKKRTNDDASSPTHSAVAILPTGTYRFKFIVDGEWCSDSHYPTVEDTDGNVNNEVFVGAASWPFEWVRVPSASPSGPRGRPDHVPVALTELRASSSNLESRSSSAKELHSEVSTLSSNAEPTVGGRSGKPSAGSGSFLDARSDGPPKNKTAMAPQTQTQTQTQKKPPLAAPVSPGVARVEAATARSASSTPFDPAVKPPEGKATKPSESWPKQIKVSTDDFSTRSEHDAKVKEETAQAFRALEFRRNERKKAMSETLPLGPYSAVSVAPSSAPVPTATPAPATRADLLTLEDRVRRLETILENHGIGVEDGWLREG
jgi:thiol-disulfide isomerase/thioredoxin